jgi:hypothetical protein
MISFKAKCPEHETGDNHLLLAPHADPELRGLHDMWDGSHIYGSEHLENALQSVRCMADSAFQKSCRLQGKAKRRVLARRIRRTKKYATALWRRTKNCFAQSPKCKRARNLYRRGGEVTIVCPYVPKNYEGRTHRNIKTLLAQACEDAHVLGPFIFAALYITDEQIV